MRESRPIPVLGEEEYFWELLCGRGVPPTIAAMRRFNIKSILDLGCGRGQAAICLYYSIGADDIHGVEAHEKKDILIKLNEDIVRNNPNERIMNSLEEFWLSFEPDATDVNAQLANTVECAELMKGLLYDTSIWSFKPPVGKKYDAIIASQLLHYMDSTDIDVVSKLFKMNSHDGTFVYYSVKDNFEKPRMSSERLLERCQMLREELSHLNVRYVKGPLSRTQGGCHIFTNL